MGNATVHPTSLWLPKKCPKNRPFFEKFDIHAGALETYTYFSRQASRSAVEKGVLSLHGQPPPPG